MKTGLVLEGGGMRGSYTIGVLDFLLDHEIEFPYVIGVSAGACNGVSYVAKQRGRSATINTKYITDNRYISVWNLFREGSIFGMDFLFKDVPERLYPFDYDAFFQTPTEFWVGATNVRTGQAEYFGKDKMDHDTTVLRASSAIPCFSPIVQFEGEPYLDGGASDSIPVEEALRAGCDRLVIVLTRHRAYRKKPQKMRAFYSTLYRKYPKMVEALETRHERYNAALERIEQLEREGKAIVFAPNEPLSIGRFEKDPEKLGAVIRMGYEDAAARKEEILSMLGKTSPV